MIMINKYQKNKFVNLVNLVIGQEILKMIHYIVLKIVINKITLLINQINAQNVRALFMMIMMVQKDVVIKINKV